MLCTAPWSDKTVEVELPPPFFDPDTIGGRNPKVFGLVHPCSSCGKTYANLNYDFGRLGCIKYGCIINAFFPSERAQILIVKKIQNAQRFAKVERFPGEYAYCEEDRIAANIFKLYSDEAFTMAKQQTFDLGVEQHDYDCRKVEFVVSFSNNLETRRSSFSLQASSRHNVTWMAVVHPGDEVLEILDGIVEGSFELQTY